MSVSRSGAGEVLVGTCSIVGDHEFQARFPVPNDYLGPSATGVLDDIRQRLLNDTEGGEVQASGDGPGGPLDPQHDGDARFPNLSDESLEVVQPRLRRSRRLPIRVRAAEPHEAPYLHQRFTTHVFDGTEGAESLPGLGAEYSLSRPGLSNDNAHVVRHHVVELAGDHSSLSGHRSLGLLLALALQPGGPVLQQNDLAAPDP